MKGAVDFYWTHALMSDEIYNGLTSNCDYSTLNLSSQVCLGFVDKANDAAGNLYSYDIYAPLCGSSSVSKSVSAFDPCSENYVHSYLNNPEVQKALHANVTAFPYHGNPGGCAVGYQNLTFVTVRGAGHFVPSYQPARALVLFSSFLVGKLLPSARGLNN
ncbi:hypothetical protein PTKIN_Ptkin09bG0131300 [Pterospermum kingtungense]